MRPPLLFIHGSCAQPAHFEAWANYFRAAGYTCLVPPLPGHAPSDPAVLVTATFDDYVSAVRAVHATLDRPPVVIGYSMGGLVAQRLAATAECAGLVLLASATQWLLPPNWPMIFRALPYVWPVLSGQPFRIDDDTLRLLVVHHLARAEQDEALRDVVPESGRAFRAMALGLIRVRARDVRCPVLCVAAGEDRIIPLRTMRRLAKSYRADLMVVPRCGHWLGAGSLIPEVARPVRDWIGELLKTRHPSFPGGPDL